MSSPSSPLDTYSFVPSANSIPIASGRCCQTRATAFPRSMPPRRSASAASSAERVAASLPSSSGPAVGSSRCRGAAAGAATGLDLTSVSPLRARTLPFTSPSSSTYSRPPSFVASPLIVPLTITFVPRATLRLPATLP